MANINLSGHYLKSGPKIIINDCTSLVIKARKKPDLLKAKDYLVYEDKEGQVYCSSLYPTEFDSTFNIDFQGIKYTVTFSSVKALIKVRGGAQ